MDQNTEQERTVANLENRVNAAEKAMTYCEREILRKNIDDFSSEEALQLGSRYVAYSLEYWFHSLDLARFRVDQDPSKRVNFLAANELRGEVESALFKAQGGDYEGVKQVLADYYQSDKADPPLDLKERLIGLSRKIPAKGLKFVLPMPAWMDPQFNGEDDRSKTDAA